jgi:hypothetical protein
MPETTENYHWIPVRDAGTFVADSFRQITISEEKAIGARVGKLSSDPDGGMVIQSYYFDKNKWSMEDAKAWVKDHKKSGAAGMQRRYIECPSQMDYRDQKNPKIIGHAAVFGKRTQIWEGFYEEVAPGAFTEAIKSDDVYALWNHDPSNVLGNTGARTLTLSEDDKGLRYEIVPPDTTLGRDLTTLIKRGDVRKSSFGFNIDDEKITKLGEGKGVLRTIVRVKPLFDVSPVTFPAYPQTDVHVRMIAGSNESLYLFEDSDKVVEVEREIVAPPPPVIVSDEELFKRFDELKGNAFGP